MESKSSSHPQGVRPAHAEIRRPQTFEELQPRHHANDNPTPSTNPKRAFGVRKPSPQFVPPIAIIEESVVMALGAAKYGAYNWQDDPVDATTYYSAAMRHLMSWFAGEDKDPESGASHLAHVRACMAILLDAQASSKLVDDRPKCASTSEAISRLSKAA